VAHAIAERSVAGVLAPALSDPADEAELAGADGLAALSPQAATASVRVSATSAIAILRSGTMGRVLHLGTMGSHDDRRTRPATLEDTLTKVRGIAELGRRGSVS